MFEVVARVRFSGAHSLPGYPGECSRVHGHNFLVEAIVEGEKTDDMGMVLDFKILKKMMRELTDNWDHQFLNDILPFLPTAELLAKHIFDNLKPRLPGHTRLVKISVSETEGYTASYFEPVTK